ncbi:minor histocompatibility antigen H13 isoform X1 [Hydra vulgaris]|uniref:minor histocompatibility antigen H13 isoform X1 n=1 Tax=Hydra vulgaris TaxID=6087 RepID=UPI000640DBC8|nr:minor histocompatibility antigen H13 [Hydra vulgaris]
MADTEIVENVVNSTSNDTISGGALGRAAATPQGLLLAYVSLVVMALLPIWYGSFRSVVFNKKQKESGEKVESMSKKDAAMFPIVASCALFGLFLFFKFFNKEYINMLLTFYFFVLGVFCVSNLLRPIVCYVLPGSFPNSNYHAQFCEGEGDSKKTHIDYKFDRIDLVCLVFAAIFGVWYLIKKHWIANNLFGLAFSLTGVELLHLNSFPIGCILLGGLFFYDIFWVFGTNVMVTVATSFEAPIKLIFPMDFLENGVNGKNFAMLGLGDIVIPGIFIALLLRYDNSKGKGSYAYFYASYISYFLGLLLTVAVLHFFKSAQPALLYLVPACIGSALLTALVKGEISELIKYEDHPEEMLANRTTNSVKKEE